jgi:cysteinyl-tRNA synthetase
LCDDLNTHEAIVFLDELARRATKQDADAANELGDNLIWLGLMRKAYAEAYGLRVKGGARSDLQNEYEREILDARAIVLNEYSISTDSEATQASLAAVNSHVRYLNPKMKIDGVSIVVSHSAAVSLESDRPESALDNDEVDRQIVARNVARKAKNFAEADRIRSELAKMGVVLKDSKDGTTWEIAR